jgi:hypothetical protein
MKTNLRIAISLLIALSSTTVGADVYKWKDANGVTQYGDRPTAGTSTQQLKIAPPPPRELTPAEKARAAREAAKQERAKAKAEASAAPIAPTGSQAQGWGKPPSADPQKDKCAAQLANVEAKLTAQESEAVTNKLWKQYHVDCEKYIH